MQTSNLRLFSILFVLLSLVSPALADSWSPPQTAQYLSNNKQWQLTIVPRRTSGLSYFTAKSEGADLAGGAKAGPRAILSRREGRQWTKVWEMPLVNDIAPPDALVADDGRHIVTFGNWFSNGPGPNVVVIYGPQGTAIRSFALRDLLSEGYIAVLPHSVSSIQWATERRLSEDNRDVVISINAPDAAFTKELPAFRLAIDLLSGKPRVLDPAEWCAASARVGSRLVEMTNDEKEAHRYLTQPLVGNVITDQSGWQQYLWEAVARLAPVDEDGEPASAWRTVLRVPSAKDYAVSEKWVKESLSGEAGMDELSFAAIDPPSLVKLFERLLTTRPNGALKDKRIYVFLPTAYHAAVTAAFSGKGAELILHDPAVPIPMKPERLQKLFSPTDYRRLSITPPVAVDCPAAS